jgi:hypothetical protein
MQGHTAAMVEDYHSFPDSYILEEFKYSGEFI